MGQLHTAMNQVGQSQTAPFETEDSSDSYNDRLTADSSCMVETNFEQSTDNFFHRCACEEARAIS